MNWRLILLAILPACVIALPVMAQSPPMFSPVMVGNPNVAGPSAITLSPPSVSAYANHRTGTAITLSTDSTVVGTVPITLSDGGIGGRFYNGSQSFQSINTVGMTASSSVTLYYCPPYNQTAPVTITASGAGTATAGVTITPYPTAGTSTININNVQWDLVSETLTGSLGSNEIGGIGLFQTELPFLAQGGFSALSNYTNIANSGNAATVSSGTYSVTGGQQWYRLNAPNNVPHTQFQAEVTISAWGGGANDIVDVGFAKDGSNYFAVEYDHNAQTLSVIQSTTSGGRVSLGSVSVNLPAGSKISAFSQIPYPSNASTQIQANYQVAGTTGFQRLTEVSTAVDWKTISVFQAYYPFFGANSSAGTTISLSSLNVGYRQCSPSGNTGLIYSVDQSGGAPLLDSNGNVYLTSTGHNGNCIFKLNTQTWQINFQSTWVASDGTTEGPFYIGMMWVPQTNQFLLTTTDEGITESTGGSGYNNPGFVLTSTNILAPGTINTVTVAPLPLPNTIAGGANSSTARFQYPQSLSFDGSVWTVVSCEVSNSGSPGGAWGPRKSTSANTSLTSTWTTVFAPTYASICDGTYIQHVGSNGYFVFGVNNGNYQTFSASLASGGSATAITNNVTFNPRGPSNSFQNQTTSGVANWGNIGAIPGEGCVSPFNACTSTRYIFPIFNPGTVTVYEAIVRYTSAQYSPWQVK